jgi:O-antigen ligase
MITMAVSGIFDRSRFARLADALVVAVAVSLPWSTSLTAILVGLWLVAVLPTLDIASLRRTMALPACYVPVALCALALLGMAWADASLAERIGSFKAFARLLVIPLLFVQFRRSECGLHVVGGFLASCTVLLALSWILFFWSSREFYPGVPFKNYIVQSGEFLIFAYALLHLAIDAWRARRLAVMAGLVLLGAVFLANIVFVATARSTLVIFAVLVLVLAFQRFDWKGGVSLIVAGAVLSGAAWASSPYLRARVLAAVQEVQDYRAKQAETSSGLRLEMWKKSLQFVSAAPVLGNGTGSVKELFQKAATGQSGPSALVTDQPHNQTLIVAIQLGLVGVALLFAMWGCHLWLFRGGGLVAWLGFGVVVHNIVACLFNSYLFEVTLGWLYLFGVGVLGGMIAGQRDRAAGGVAPGAERR